MTEPKPSEANKSDKRFMSDLEKAKELVGKDALADVLTIRGQKTTKLYKLIAQAISEARKEGYEQRKREEAV